MHAIAICVLATGMVVTAAYTTVTTHRRPPPIPVRAAEQVDDTTTIVPKSIRVIPITKQSREQRDQFTERLPEVVLSPVVAPVKEAAAEPVIAPPAPGSAAAPFLDVCQRHHMHKVWLRGGRVWRCR